MRLRETAMNGALLALLGLALLGCPPGATPVDGNPSPDATAGRILVRSVALEGTTEEAAAVEVSGVADLDGVADQTWRASFELDDGTSSGSLPSDQGGEEQRALEVRATRQSDGQVLLKQVSLRFHGDAGAGEGGPGADAGPGGEWPPVSDVDVGQGFDCAALPGSAPVGPALPLLGLVMFCAGLVRRRRL